MTIRDTRKNEAYFIELKADFDEALLETQEALDAGNFTSPSERVNVAQRLFQLAIMRVVTHYSAGTDINLLKPYVLAILPYRLQLKVMADKLPKAHQFYREDFERLGGAQDADGSANINRYVNTLWWLSLLKGVAASDEHIKQALAIIGERGKDTLFDNIAIALGDSNTEVADELYHPEIYQTLSDAWSAPQANKATLLNQFIQQWYDNLEEADWYESHDCDCEFEYTDYYIGYWSFEHALVVNLLNIPITQLEQHSMIAVDCL